MTPCVSIVIATYQWSGALRCALRSVLRQTLQDFEVLVVGDGCTDDSEAVVGSFGDARLRWHNLPANTGGQSAPNNQGFALSTGRYIAYLGHDDIWYPTHLQSLVETIEARQADLAYAVAMVYGPAESGTRFVTGLLGAEGFTERDCVPPSSILLRRALLDRIGPWRPPTSLGVPVDYDLERRALREGAVFAGTEELTVFKFNTAYRRNAYRSKDTAEQAAMLARIETGRDFRQQEWAALACCFLTGRSWATRIPADLDRLPEGALHAQNRRFKGVEPSANPPPLTGRLQRRLEQGTPGFEWHALETTAEAGSFRWSGPSTRASIQLPAPSSQALVLTIKLLRAVTPDTLAGLRVMLNGKPVGGALEQSPDGAVLLHLRHDGIPGEPAGLLLTFEVPRTVSLAELGVGFDTRPLGIAVNWVEIAPA